MKTETEEMTVENIKQMVSTWKMNDPELQTKIEMFRGMYPNFKTYEFIKAEEINIRWNKLTGGGSKDPEIEIYENWNSLENEINNYMKESATSDYIDGLKEFAKRWTYNEVLIHDACNNMWFILDYDDENNYNLDDPRVEHY